MHGYRQKDNNMYILSRDEIEEIATKKLKEFSPLNLESPMPLRTTDFLENYLGLVVKHKYICDFQSGILALTVMGNEALIPSYDEAFQPIVLEETFGTVLITPQLSGRDNLPRKRYTEMHEAAHFILHQPYFSQCEKNAAASRDKYLQPFIACRKVELQHNEVLNTDFDWLEYQADALAAAMLMPKNVFISYTRSTLRKNGVRRNYLCADTRESHAIVHRIIYDIANTFNVSYQAAKIRMLHLGVLKECNHYFS